MRTIFNFGLFDGAILYVICKFLGSAIFKRKAKSESLVYDSGRGLVDVPKHRLCPCLSTCRLGPSASSARFLTDQKLTNGV
jgi:hypothetical protein